MNQSVRIQGASSRETFWFSTTSNAVAGQIDHIQKDGKTASICCVKALEWVTSPSRRTFPCIFLQFYCHFDPVYESMT